MKKSYDYILFDWDGCLARTLDLILELYRQLFLEFNLPHSDKDLISIWGDWRGPVKLGISEEQLPIWVTKYKQGLMEKSPHIALYEGVSEMLTALQRQGKHLALLSSSEKSSIEPALDRYQLRKFFDVCLYAGDVINHKPNPEIIDKALKQLSGFKDRAIIIGDSKSDLGAAKNAGIDSMLYFPKHNEQFYSRDTLMSFEPTYVISDFSEVVDIVK